MRMIPLTVVTVENDFDFGGKPTAECGRNRHPRLRPLKRVCWSELTMAGSPRTGRVRRIGPKLPHTLTSENNCLPAARCIQATPFGKIDEPAVCAIARSCLDPKNQPVACLAVQHGSGGAFGGDGIMNPRRFTTVAPAFCGSLVLAGVIVGWLAGFGSAGTENTGAVPIEKGAASLAANARLADEPQAIAMANAAVANAAAADAAGAAAAGAAVATAAEPVTGTATDPTARSH